MKKWAKLALCVCMAVSGGLASASEQRPMRIVVAAASGGGSDVFTRIVADKLSAVLGQHIIIENRPGAGGAIAAEYAAKAEPDGLTLFAGTPSTLVMLPLVSKVNFDPIRDFDAISQFIKTDVVIVTQPDLGFHSLNDLVDYAKKNPGKLKYGTGGIGTTQHLAGELLSQAAGIELLHVPYRGTAMAQPDLITGRIDMMFDNIPPSINFIRDGRTRAVAVASDKRASTLPDVATAAEQGYPELEIYTWVALYAPKGTPASAIERIDQAMKVVLDDPEVQEKLRQQGNTDGGAYTPPKQTAALLQAEIAK